MHVIGDLPFQECRQAEGTSPTLFPLAQLSREPTDLCIDQSAIEKEKNRNI